MMITIKNSPEPTTIPVKEPETKPGVDKPGTNPNTNPDKDPWNVPNPNSDPTPKA